MASLHLLTASSCFFPYIFFFSKSPISFSSFSSIRFFFAFLYGNSFVLVIQLQQFPNVLIAQSGFLDLGIIRRNSIYHLIASMFVCVCLLVNLFAIFFFIFSYFLPTRLLIAIRSFNLLLYAHASYFFLFLPVQILHTHITRMFLFRPSSASFSFGLCALFFVSYSVSVGCLCVELSCNLLLLINACLFVFPILLPAACQRCRRICLLSPFFSVHSCTGLKRFSSILSLSFAGHCRCSVVFTIIIFSVLHLFALVVHLKQSGFSLKDHLDRTGIWFESFKLGVVLIKVFEKMKFARVTLAFVR